MTRKSRVKSQARAERMKAKWADPAYRHAMIERAKAQRQRERDAKGSAAPAAPAEPSAPAAAAPPAAPTKPSPTSGRRGWTPGRRWR